MPSQADRIHHLQRQAQKQLIRIAAQRADHFQGVAVSAQQNVLAVIKRLLLNRYRARAAAGLRCSFKQRDTMTIPHQTDGGAAAAQPAPITAICC
jgi:hypothetical protein